MKYTLMASILALVLSALAVGQTLSVNYIYDPAGRLTSVDYGQGTTIAYTYDNAGNLLTRIVTTPPPASNPAQIPRRVAGVACSEPGCDRAYGHGTAVRKGKPLLRRTLLGIRRPGVPRWVRTGPGREYIREMQTADGTSRQF